MQLVGKISETLADLDFLSGVYREFKVAGRFEDEHDGAAEAEAAHLFRRRQGLATENGRGGRVDGFGICSRWRRASTDVGS